MTSPVIETSMIDLHGVSFEELISMDIPPVLRRTLDQGMTVSRFASYIDREDDDAGTV